VKGLTCGYKSSFVFSKTWMRYSQSISGCVGRSTFSVLCNFSKLSRSILEILGHDFKLCDRNLSLSWLKLGCVLALHICVAQDAPKTHVNCMLFETSWVVMANMHFNIFLILFLHVNQRLIVAFNMEFTHYFLPPLPLFVLTVIF